MMESSNKLYPCHVNPTIPGEQFIPAHIFIYLIRGEMTVYGKNGSFTIKEGDYCLVRRNQLAKYVKKGTEKGAFKTFSIFFNATFLKSFSDEYGIVLELQAAGETMIKLEPNSLFESFIQSMVPYENLKGDDLEDFLVLKHKEILLILLKTNPTLKNILFDFSTPGKIDLQSFMNQNFKFNVKIERYAYLTGRSLTAFKRDFEKVYNMAPGRWLLEKRLEEAHFLIVNKSSKPTEVYLEVGFEDLSHFSYAFKKKYGVSPTQLRGSTK